jgi:Domain of unknown function (DUF5615)
VYGAVASALRSAGIDAVSTPEVGRLGESDESQLEWATAEERAIVTFNVAHFAALHAIGCGEIGITQALRFRASVRWAISCDG